MTKPILSIRDLNAHYGENHALKDIQLDIESGGIFAILGPSGSGKTTLLRVVAGFEDASSGEVLLDGENLLTKPAHKRHVGLMFQSYALFPHMSIAKNIAFGLEAEGLPKAEIESRVAEVLDTIGLAHLAQRRPAQLSGGQKQRVALARALVKRPNVLLLDEPLSALDRKIRADMQSELKRLQREMGMTFIIVTHDQEEAMSLADRVALLKDGAIEQVGSPEDLYERPETEFTASFIGASTIMTGTPTATGVNIVGIGTIEVDLTNEMKAASEVLVIVRPENVELVSDGSTELSGVFETSSYLGGANEAEVRMGEYLVRARVKNLPSVESGERVGVVFAPGSIRALLKTE